MPPIFPAMAVPVVCTPSLRRALADYRDVLGFQVVQQLPGVLAVLQQGSVRLQLWQRPDAFPGDCHITLQGSVTEIFELHARLTCHSRGPVQTQTPRLQPWAAWEFSLNDAQGNRLTFIQWAVTGESGRAQDHPRSGRGRQAAP